MCLLFYSPFQLPVDNNFPAVSRFTLPTAKEHPIDPFTCRSWSIFFAKILASLSRNITDSMHTNRNSVANIRFRTPILPSELLKSAGGEKRVCMQYSLVHTLACTFARYSRSWDPTVSPLRHASLSPCASCVTDKKLDFHVIVLKHGHARDIARSVSRVKIGYIGEFSRSFLRM